MKRAVTVLVAVVLLPGALLFGGQIVSPRALARAPSDRDGEQTPASGNGKQAAYLNPGDYYRMENPREAARLLRERADQLGYDLNKPLYVRPKGVDSRKLRDYESRHIHLPSGDIYPDTLDRSFVDEARALVAAGKREESAICLVLLRLDRTLGHIVWMMEQGIRVYRDLPGTAVIVGLPIKQIEHLASQLLVDWMGRYEPRYKYREDRTYDRDFPTYVYSLDGDKPEFQDELRRNGVNVLRYFVRGDRRGYDIVADKRKIATLAQLWWVWGVFQSDAIIETH